MYLSKVKLTPEGVRYVGKLRGEGRYSMHQALFRIFEEDPEAQRDFLYVHDGLTLETLVLSSRKPLSQHQYFEIETKDFDPPFQEGMLLQFTTEVNPITRIEVGGKRKKTGIVEHARVQALEAGEKPGHDLEIAATEGLKWFQRREDACGFVTEDFDVISYQKEWFRKSNGRRVVLDIMRCTGVIRLTDTELFREALRRGLGSSRSFGCGLLLVKPI